MEIWAVVNTGSLNCWAISPDRLFVSVFYHSSRNEARILAMGWLHIIGPGLLLRETQ